MTDQTAAAVEVVVEADGVELVPLSRLSLHPRNVRQGDVGAISESLVAHGQYRTIVAQRSTGHVLAGNHTFRALLATDGFDVARVEWRDVPDDEALRIMLTDNATADRATNDSAGLAALLTDLAIQTEAGLAGTGYDGEFLDDLLALVGAPLDLDSLRHSLGEPGERDFWPVIRLTVSPDLKARYDAATQHLDDDEAKLALLLGER